MPSAESDILRVSEATQLRRFDPYQATEMELATMLPWYSDQHTARLVDGPDAQPYDLDKLNKMFRYLHDHGELYLIESLEAGRWSPVGDVTLQRAAIPIVLAPAARNQGIGRAVVGTLIERARGLGWRTVEVSDIYSYNHPSRRMFEGLGFVQGDRTDLGRRYSLQL